MFAALLLLARLTHGNIELTPNLVYAGQTYEVEGCGFDPITKYRVCVPASYYTDCGPEIMTDSMGCFGEFYTYAPYEVGKYKVQVAQFHCAGRYNCYLQTVAAATLVVE